MWGKSFLYSAGKQFNYYKVLADKAIASIPPEKIYWQPADGANSVGIIIQHITGNMMSRFTDFLISDGEKPWRDRDNEFLSQNLPTHELMYNWNKAWRTLFMAMDEVDPENLERIVYIRNEQHTIIQSINRQLPHYGYHIGQIIYIAKMINGNQWESLSIPIGSSDDYNKNKFANPTPRIDHMDVIVGEIDAKL